MENDASTVALQVENAALKNEITELKTLVKYYEEQFRLNRHRQFGASSEKSEYDLSQLNLFNEAEIMAAPEQPEPELVEVEKHYRKRTRLTTEKLPEDLPVEVIDYELPEAEHICEDCGGKLHIMSHDVRRELVIIPAQAKIREHRCAVYSCRCCETTNIYVPIRQAEIPKPVIKGSFTSPEAVRIL